MMKLFLIRHGQTTANLDKIYAGQTDVKLTQQGRQEAERIRPILAQIPFDRVYSSDLSRAVDTQRLAIPGVQAEQTPLLREFDVGTLVGKQFANAFDGVDDIYRRTRNYSIFGGESGDMVCQRLRKFLDQLEAEPCENVAAFTHNGIMGSMLQLVLDVRFDVRAVRSNNCAINVFEFDGSRWKMIAWNYMGNV